MRRLADRPWLPAGVWAGLILIGTSLPLPALPPGPPGSDKLVHLLMYGVLGALLAGALLREHPGRGRLLLLLMSTSLAAGFGLFDEWHQQFCQRSPSTADWLADVIGAGSGATILCAVNTIRAGGSKMPEARRISGADLSAELTKPEPCVVEFWMVGCPACARFGPTFGDLAEEYQGRANLVAIEARENMDAAKQYAIRGVPTVIVFKDGQEVQRMTGAKTLAEMREWLNPVLG